MRRRIGWIGWSGIVASALLLFASCDHSGSQSTTSFNTQATPVAQVASPTQAPTTGVATVVETPAPTPDTLEVTIVQATPSGTPTPRHLSRPQVLTGPSAAVTALAWSPDGTRFAAAGSERPDNGGHAIHLWRADGLPLATLNGHADLVTCLAWSPDGTVLASGSLDHSVRLWDDSGKLVTLISGKDGPGGPVWNLSWSPDGRTLAVGILGQPSYLDGSVSLYRSNGTFLRALPGTLATGGKFLNLAWSPDGTLLAAGAVSYKIWHLDGTLAASLSLGGTPSWGLAWSPDGKVIAIGDENGNVGFWTPDGQEIGMAPPLGPVGDLSFSPDGTRLAVATYSPDALTILALAGSTASPASDDYQANRQGRWSNAEAAWTRDESKVAAVMGDAVYAYRPDHTLLSIDDGCSGEVIALAWSPDGKTLAAGTQGKQVCLWR